MLAVSIVRRRAMLGATHLQPIQICPAVTGVGRQLAKHPHYAQIPRSGSKRENARLHKLIDLLTSTSGNTLPLELQRRHSAEDV